MLTGLSLRLRIFLFFCLLAFGGLAITTGGLIAGYMRAGQPELFDAYVFSGLVIGFLVLALVTGVWLLFDENVAKPIERLASELRVRAHTGVAGGIDTETAKYLGDLARRRMRLPDNWRKRLRMQRAMWRRRPPGWRPKRTA